MIKILKSDKNLWDLFIKKEEYNPMFLDKYRRFPYYLSEHRNVVKPIISEHLIQNGLKVEYPDNKKFAVCLTHDIDTLHISKLNTVKNITRSIQKLKFDKVLKSLLSSFNKKYNSLYNFTQIMDLEEKFQAKSSFYFLALDKRNLDYNYKVDSLSDNLKNIIDRGWEVGLHGGHYAYVNLKELKKQKKRIENVIKKKVLGYRNHFMRFKVPTTWELLKEAGFEYDTTFGYADCVGFRNGTCHPFKPFNLNTKKTIDIWEISLAIMEGTLFEYMNLDMENAWKITKTLIDYAERFNGVITVLWHNTSMFDDLLKFYKKLLNYCYQKNAWITSGGEILKWWEQHDFLKISE